MLDLDEINKNTSQCQPSKARESSSEIEIDMEGLNKCFQWLGNKWSA